ncbi:lipopolysaccharide biosynthesis protein [Inconstantimicrobium mannanitabidum]|uniref:Sugar translocase n=1 Tax=Inconstantimicrobium mannanitabidum TaxID=1604901 RepID=A0ACB5RDW2_9CLOT|nr:oligosaccharide flippase family protein [Clostridium sp. TW13]GKX67458.1 sugar translocase [Clostridium sp. TW13]
MKRTDYVVKNIATGVIMQVVIILLGFVSRKIFIQYIGIEYLGINGLLTNILSMLSLVDLGIGSAIYYSLYKPLAERNYNQVKAIMNLYSKLYKFIGILVAVLGLMLLPFLKYIMKTDISSTYVNTVYIVFLMDSVLSYFLAYRSNILSADQKGYILNNISTVFTVITTLAQISIVFFTRNYILFLVVKLVLGVIKNIFIYVITNKKYSYLMDKNKPLLKAKTKREIIKNAKALFIVNISTYFVFGTDNILLSTFVGVAAVGLYSNYLLLINTVNTLIGQIFQGIKASFGNFMVQKNLKEANEIFEILYFINFWISTFCAISLFILLNPFIELWLGKGMLFNIITVAILVFNFYFRGMTNAIEVVRNAAGLYNPYPFFKFWSLTEGVLNLILAMIFSGLFKMGMVGIFLATSVSTCITAYVLPWNVYKYVFKMSSRRYYIKHIVYMFSTLVIASITYFISSLVTTDNHLSLFMVKMVACVFVPNSLIVLFFRSSKEFKYLMNKFNVKNAMLLIRKKHK